MIRSCLVIFSIIVLLIACDNTRLYEKNRTLENKIWPADSALEFQFQITDSKIRYNLLCNIRNTISYPYHNLYLQYTLTDTLGNSLHQDLLHHNLFDPKTGKPLGSGLGDVFDHQFPILTHYKFDRVGMYNIELKQYMRMDTLPHILAAGVRLELTEELTND